MISRYKTGKHFTVTITDTTLAVRRRQDRIDAEAALDGFYVLRTPVPADELAAPAVVTAYKNLKYVERDFRHIRRASRHHTPLSTSRDYSPASRKHAPESNYRQFGRT